MQTAELATDLATKSDLNLFKLEVKADMQKIRNELLYCIIGSHIMFAAIIVSLLK